MVSKGLFVFGINDSFHIDFHIIQKIIAIRQFQFLMLAAINTHRITARFVINEESILVKISILQGKGSFYNTK